MLQVSELCSIFAVQQLNNSTMEPLTSDNLTTLENGTPLVFDFMGTTVDFIFIGVIPTLDSAFVVSKNSMPKRVILSALRPSPWYIKNK